ncbi:MAG: hypothetical protein KAG37_02960 [Flavobacteriales bacterium]|nr:hypothetical protein [Flavobacteriales bacterium]
MSDQLDKQNNLSPRQVQDKDEKDHKLKVLVWIFGILLISALGYIFYSYGINKDNEEYLIQQKEEIIGELAQMELQYEGVKLSNDSLNTEMLDQQDRISSMRDSLDQMKAYPGLLRKYKRLVNRMKKEKRQLFLLADSLDTVNQILVVQRDSAEMKLQEQTRMTERLANQNLDLAKAVEKGAVLDVFNLKSEGVKISSSGKISTTSRVRRTDKIRVCMTLGRNKLTKVGYKNIFVRIATPDDTLLQSTIDDNSFVVDGEKMDFSAKTEIYYEQESLDVCVFVDGNQYEFQKGVYLVAVYADGSFIGETEMMLK